MNEKKENVTYDIKKLVTEKNLYKVREYVDVTPINEVIDELNNLNDLEISLFFRFLKTEAASELFSHLPEDMQHLIVQNLTKKEISDIINELYTDEIADVLEAMPPDMAKTILLTVDKTTRIKVNQILQYHDDEVGSIMSVDLIVLKDSLTNKEALKLIEIKRKESEVGQFYYVVNDKNVLIGATTLEDIVFSNKNDLISQKTKFVPSVKTKQLKEEAARIFADEDYSTLPVINENGILMGMLTSDDVIDILQAEADEDLYKASGISMSNQPTVSYLKASVLSLVRSRVFWLIILMIGSTISQVVIQFFNQNLENKFQQIESLSAGVSSIMLALIPVTSATSGNAGSQSTSTLTRAASLGELKEGKMKYVIGKETLVGFILGLILAVANYARLLIYYMATSDIFKPDLQIVIFLISLVSSISLLISITFSKFLGTSILIIGLKLKKDPAVMATPLLTTLIDGISTLIFFGLSYAILIPAIF